MSEATYQSAGPRYKSFLDGMQAAAEICGSLAETTYDDTDAFEAATGCEAAIMRVVREQRKVEALSGQESGNANEAIDAEKPEAARVGGETPNPMDEAPKDGTMIRLLVDYTDGGAPLEDAEKAWTIGFNSLDDTGDDEWKFAGWCWSHDHFTHGTGTPIGWLPWSNPALATQPAAGSEGAQAPHVFLDCDGVLADFDTYAEAYFGMPPRQYEKQVGSSQFWKELEAKGDFYRNLPLMPDAMALVEGVRHLKPTILTGCPRGNWAEAQKIAWAHEHFPDIPVITCRSADKRLHAKRGDVLIDDWPEHRHRWIEMGGVFISHFDAESSLASLWAHYPALRAPGGES